MAAEVEPRSPDVGDFAGVRICVLRGAEFGHRVAERVRHRGGEPRFIPLIEVTAIESQFLKQEVRAWVGGGYDWLILTSANAVHAIEHLGEPLAASRASRVAVVGPGTAAHAEQIGLTVDLVPEHDFTTEGLVDALLAGLAGTPKRCLFPASNLTDDRLQRALEAAGHEVVRVTAYETNEVPTQLDLRREFTAHSPTVVLVTSASAARALAHQAPILPAAVKIAAIGRPSADALTQLGIHPDVVSARHTIDGLLDAVADHLHSTGNEKEIMNSTPPIPLHRPRRLRSSAGMRRLVAETRIHPASLVLPAFVREGLEEPRAITAMPGVEQHSLDSIRRLAVRAAAAGLGGIMLFGVPSERDARGSGADNPEGILNRAVRAVRDEVGDSLVVQSDLCLDEFTSHGHCGVLDGEGRIDNDATLDRYASMAIAQAEAGAQVLGLSGMMDGQVAAVRYALDRAGHTDTALLAYAAKYASAFYGPFREAVDSQLQGDRRSYQQDPANRRESVRETLLDIEEGADIVMVKPALSYLDILSDVAKLSTVPVWAYQVSGELAMIEAAAQNGWIDREAAIHESLLSIARAGADVTLSYFALEVAEWNR